MINGLQYLIIFMNCSKW